MVIRAAYTAKAGGVDRFFIPAAIPPKKMVLANTSFFDGGAAPPFMVDVARVVFFILVPNYKFITMSQGGHMFNLISDILCILIYPFAALLYLLTCIAWRIESWRTGQPYDD